MLINCAESFSHWLEQIPYFISAKCYLNKFFDALEILGNYGQKSWHSWFRSEHVHWNATEITSHTNLKNKLELARFSTLLRIQDGAKCGKGSRTENIYTGRGDTVHTLLRWGHCTYLILVGTPHMPQWGGDTAHSLLGWGHRTTLQEISLSTKF